MNKSLTPIDYFPLSVATGQAFCNRETEIKQLKTCLEHCRPVLLVSPRRYGKTSLALQAINQTKLPYAAIDLFSAIDEQDIEKAILKGIGKLISQMESIPKRALALAAEIFDGSHIRAVLSNVELSIEVNRQREKPAYQVLDILERLERLTKKTQKKIVLFFDEFQCINEITPDHAMESVLRQVAQLTKSMTFVFSGSNRHLLNQLFEDRKRPFYKLCEKITLDRISEESYSKHIQKAFKQQWNSELSMRELDSIFHHTERHPYYVNLLCSRLINGVLPDVGVLDQIWQKYVMEERSQVASELELLSKNQRKLLIVLARSGGSAEPLGHNFIQQAKMSKASLDQALTTLEKRDYIFKDEQGYFRVLDPLIKGVLLYNQ